MNAGEFWRIARFGVVGVAATATHATIAYLLLTLLHWHPLAANVSGFICAFVLSFAGHSRWTFADANHPRGAVFRFFAVQLFGLALSNGLLWLLLHVNTPRLIALGGAILIVPPTSYILSRLWAFRTGS